MAVARLITARVVPDLVAKDLAAVATTIAAAAGIDTAVVVPGAAGGRVDQGVRYIFVTTDKQNLASTCKTDLDAALAASGVKLQSQSPQLESNDADNAVTISRAAGATTVRFTATDPDQSPDNSITFTIAKGGISDAAFTNPIFAPISDGVVDLAIDLQGGDSAGPYTVVVSATDVQGNVATCDLVVTSSA
jgi:thiamine pyrophosphokinase